MSTEGWSFLVVGIVALVVGFVEVGPGDSFSGGWLTGGDGSAGGWFTGKVGSGGLGLPIGAAGLVAGVTGLYTLPNCVTSAHIFAA